MGRDSGVRFADRNEAGRELAGRLTRYACKDTVVAGLPRGGVVVASEVAARLSCPLDVMVAGKLRAPGNPELAIGAVAEAGAVYLNREAIAALGVDHAYIEEEKRRRLEEAKERLARYRAVREKVPLAGRTVILVDDGVATGSTMIASVQAARAEGAARVVAAVPGGPEERLGAIAAMEEVTELVCLAAPEAFYAVSQLYTDFAQVDDDTVLDILAREAPGG